MPSSFYSSSVKDSTDIQAKAGESRSVRKHLSSIQEALSSIPSTVCVWGGGGRRLRESGNLGF